MTTQKFTVGDTATNPTNDNGLAAATRQPANALNKHTHYLISLCARLARAGDGLGLLFILLLVQAALMKIGGLYE